jgi:hypothetical protein
MLRQATDSTCLPHSLKETMMKHLIRLILGLIPLSVLIGLGLLYHFQLWIFLAAALCALVYPLGWWLGGILFPPNKE